MQLDIFITQDSFRHCSRGHIETMRIWKEMNVHQRINIRSHFFNSAFYSGIPNFSYMTIPISQHFDTWQK